MLEAEKNNRAHNLNFDSIAVPKFTPTDDKDYRGERQRYPAWHAEYEPSEAEQQPAHRGASPPHPDLLWISGRVVAFDAPDDDRLDKRVRHERPFALVCDNGGCVVFASMFRQRLTFSYCTKTIPKLHNNNIIIIINNNIIINNSGIGDGPAAQSILAFVALALPPLIALLWYLADPHGPVTAVAPKRYVKKGCC
jgi:hypothetical protein